MSATNVLQREKPLKQEQRYCASNDWSAGHITGDGIPSGMCILSLHRITPAFLKNGFARPLRYGELDNKLVSENEYRAMLVEHGYLTPYFRKMWWTREQFSARAHEQGRI